MLRSNSKSLENHVVSLEEEKERLQWEGFAEKEGFKSGRKERVGDGKLMIISMTVSGINVAIERVKSVKTSNVSKRQTYRENEMDEDHGNPVLRFFRCPQNWYQPSENST